MEVEETKGHLDISAIRDALGQADGDRQPMLSVLVEAGPGLATALVRGGHVDRLHLFVAPTLLGDGIRALDDLGVSSLAEAVSFSETEWEQVGTDMLFTGYVRTVDDLIGE